MKYSKEEKQKYFASLREKWQQAKELSEKDNTAKGLFEALRMQGIDISYTGFYYTYASMKAQGLEGNPYIDCKTFKGWKENGFSVKKGEKSKIEGITWLFIDRDDTAKKTTGDNNFMIPKVYHLFHRSQVEIIE